MGPGDPPIPYLFLPATAAFVFGRKENRRCVMRFTLRMGATRPLLDRPDEAVSEVAESPDEEE